MALVAGFLRLVLACRTIEREKRKSSQHCASMSKRCIILVISQIYGPLLFFACHFHYQQFAISKNHKSDFAHTKENKVDSVLSFWEILAEMWPFCHFWPVHHHIGNMHLYNV